MTYLRARNVMMLIAMATRDNVTPTLPMTSRESETLEDSF